MADEQIEWMAESNLPSPRLQLRWRRPASKKEERFGGETWICVYEIVLRLDEHDIRRESDDTERLRHGHWVSPISHTMVGKDGREPCFLNDGSRFVDRPFRDSAHAQWDTKQLGNLPIYVVAQDGLGALVPPWTDKPVGSDGK